MAIDQAIFEAHAAGMVPPTVRVYTWGDLVITLGRLQSEEAAKAEFPGLPHVRRPTGGRAVAHGGDLTICVVVGEETLRPLAARRGVLSSYYALVAPVVAVLEEAGVPVDRGRDRRRHGGSQDCFGQAASCDLIDCTTGKKLLGSAQLRAKGATLQQMSLRPLEKVDILSADFENRLRHHFTQALHIAGWVPGNELTASEITRAREIEACAPALTEGDLSDNGSQNIDMR